MDTTEKVLAGVLMVLMGVLLGLLFAAGMADGQNNSSYHKACAERNGVTVYNGSHYECFVK